MRILPRAFTGDSREHEMLLATALWGTGVGLWELNFRTGLTRWLSDWCQQLNIDPCDGANQVERWDANIHPEDVREAKRLFEAHLAGAAEYYDTEYRIRDRAGAWHWVFERGRVVERTAKGAPVRMVGVVMDIGARKKAELEAARNQRLLQIALETARGGLHDCDIRANTTRCSEFFFTILGETPDPNPRSADFWWDRMHPDDVPRVRREFENLREGRAETFESEYRVRHADGSYRWVLDRSRATERDSEGRATRVVGFVVDVTERVRTEEALLAQRKLAEDALRENEAVLRAVTQHTPDWLFLIDEQLTVRFLNRPFGNFRSEDVLGHNLVDFSPPQDRERIEAIYRGVFATGAHAGFELRYLKPDGKYRHCEYRVVPVVDAGEVRSVIVAVTDVTERKRAEIALKESQSILQTVAASSADWLALFDLNRRCIFLNRPIHDRPPEEWLGQQVESFVPPEDRARVHDVFEHVMRTGEPRDFAQVISDPTRGLRYLELRVRAVQNEERIFGAAVNITEVTEQNAQREALRTQAHILETMREGVVLVDSASDSIRLTNAAFDRMFGYRHEELLGQKVTPLLNMPAAQRRRFERSMHNGSDSGDPTPVEFECARRDGSTFIASCVVQRLQMTGSDQWIAVLNDVTERRRLEREIIEIANREQQRIGSDLHDGLGQDLTGIALILRSVVAQLREEGSAARLDVEDVIGLVNNAIESTRALARGLSPVSADRGGLAAALQSLATRASERFGIHVSFNGGLTDAQLDESSATHLYRIAQEAFTNVVRHGHASRVTITLDEVGDELQLRVEDNGRGFAQTPPDGADGLGLKIMRYRTRMLGGDLMLETSPEGGAMVRCSCPLDRVGVKRERLTPFRAWGTRSQDA